MDHFVQLIILYCVHLSSYCRPYRPIGPIGPIGPYRAYSMKIDAPTLELNMPCLNPPLDPSLPYSHTPLLWRTSIVAASGASFASIYNVVQTE